MNLFNQTCLKFCYAFITRFRKKKESMKYYIKLLNNYRERKKSKTKKKHFTRYREKLKTVPFFSFQN